MRPVVSDNGTIAADQALLTHLGCNSLPVEYLPRVTSLGIRCTPAPTRRGTLLHRPVKLLPTLYWSWVLAISLLPEHHSRRSQGLLPFKPRRQRFAVTFRPDGPTGVVDTTLYRPSAIAANLCFLSFSIQMFSSHIHAGVLLNVRRWHAGLSIEGPHIAFLYILGWSFFL